MVLVALYRTNSEQARPVYEFLEMLRRRYPGKPVVELDIETREGAAEATLYGVVQYPALVVRSLDGHVQGMWEGVPLPLIDEVAGLMLEQQGYTE
jgi:predicted P-loop ATPase